MARYPIPAWPLALGLIAYAALLWRCQWVFLLVIPTVLPALALGLWTGWMVIGEADLFVLATVAVLLIRAPPTRRDLLPTGVRRAVLLLLIASTMLSTLIGLDSPLGYAGHSDNPFLRPDNALRLAKGLGEALLLLPFLLHRQRTHADAVSWLAWGIVAGLIAVTCEVLVERLLFAGLLDFTTDYRVAGPFTSMRVGGGHIGAYLAMVLPFAFVMRPARRWLLPLLVIAEAGGAYTLVVTFARTAYAAALLGGAVTAAGLLLPRRRIAAFAIIPVLLLVAAVAGAASFGVMRERFNGAAADLVTREVNWREGWSVRDADVLTGILGMGLGTFQRTMQSRATANGPSDLSVERDGDGAYVSMRVETPFFLGQKVVVPPNGHVHLSLRFNALDPHAVLGFLLCDKVLLYSDNCQGGQLVPRTPGIWEDVSVVLPTAGLGATALFGLVRRPVELSLFDASEGTTIAVRDITLSDTEGQSLLANGDFRHGLDRWLFTDDSHVAWRILDQYLMLMFETGIVGLAAFLAFSGLALVNGIQAAFRGNAMGAAVAGAIVSFLISGLFDNVLEAPRVATLYFLICITGLLLGEADSET